MIIATTTELQNSFGKFLNLSLQGNEILITKKGKTVARLISQEKSVSFLADSLTGILQNNYDDKQIAAERLQKYKI